MNNKLRNVTIEAARAKAADYRLNDGGGLHLFVTRAGAKIWRLRRFHEGRETTIVLGPYPAFSLKEARERRDAIRVADARGEPLPFRPAPQATQTLREIAVRWRDTNAAEWRPTHIARFWRELAVVLDAVGDLPIEAVTPALLLPALDRMQREGSIDTARRTRRRLENVFAFASSGVVPGYAANPAYLLRGAMAKQPANGRRPAVTSSIDEVREILRRIEARVFAPTTVLAMRFLALTAQRPSEAAGARWDEMTLAPWTNQPVWVIPVARRKLKTRERARAAPHIVPLSRQAVEVLEAIRQITGHREHVFASVRKVGTPLRHSTLSQAMRDAGMAGDAVPHGWRSSFSSLMNNRNPADQQVIELMLAHKVGGVAGAYNRGEHIERRHELAQIWADMLMDGMPPAAVLAQPRILVDQGVGTASAATAAASAAVLASSSSASAASATGSAALSRTN